MADSIRIDTGVKRILVNDDPQRVIVFNPDDVVFAEKFYHLLSDFESKEKEFVERAEALDANTALDEHGIPENTQARLAMMKEVCGYLREQIDHVFGQGTAQAAFENAMTLEMFAQFFNGLEPFIRKARADVTDKYRPANRSRVMK